MLKIIALYAFGFAAVGVVNSLVQSVASGDGVAVHLGLVVTMFVMGAIGGLLAERRFVS